MALRPGDRVEHFAIVSLLGQGGMGRVYAARDLTLDRTVALKILQPSASGSDEGGGSTGAARLLREARAAAALEHPNVVTIYEVGAIQPEDGAARCPFIAMELIKGASLRAYVHDAEVSIETRVRWLTDVARALAAAHRAGIVHRDMKPENVMVRDDGVVKVLDFGIAKRAERAPAGTEATTSSEAKVLPSITEAGVAVGTPHYMAPEQMRREDLDGRADQFSWGVVAYELLSGVMPWGLDADPLELVARLLTESPKPLAELRPDVPAAVSAVVARAMAKRRADRFASMDDVVRALEDRGPLAARPTADAPAQPTPAPRARRSSRAVVGALAGAATIAAAAVIGIVARSVAAPAGAPASASSPATSASSGECRGARECVAKLGKPAVCGPSHACVAVDDARCTARYEPEDLARDDVVWVGAMFPLTGDDARWGVSNLQAVELARRDFAVAGRALRAPGKAGGPPPVALVACDDARGSDESAAHLVRDLGVPAVVGFGGGKSVDLTASWFVPNDAMVVASITQSPLLARIPQKEGHPRLVWRTTYDNVEIARAIAASAARLEARLRANRALRPAEPMRVAVARRKDASHAAFAEELFRALVINGKSAIQNEDDYREFSLDAGAGPEEIRAVAAAIARFSPTLVVSSANNDLVARIEEAWPASSTRRPYYQTHAVIDDDLLRFIGTSADRRARVAGFTSVSDTVPNARFVVHYNETFADQITRTWAPNSSYDAFYVAAYAAYAAAAGPRTGDALARAVERLQPPGTPVDVGPTGIFEAYGALARGEHIDLNGATGSLDFDAQTGDAPVDLAALCAAVDAHGAASESIESGVVFDAKANRLGGEPRCP